MAVFDLVLSNGAVNSGVRYLVLSEIMGIFWASVLVFSVFDVDSSPQGNKSYGLTLFALFRGKMGRK